MDSRIARAIATFFVGLAVTGCASDQDRTSAPNPNPLADLHERQDDEKTEVFTGTLEGGIMAIGAETTGWRLIGDGEAGALEVDISRIRDQVEQFNGRRVAITGQVISRSYVERGKVAVLVAHRIQPAD